MLAFEAARTAPLFAALGDATRLTLINRLSEASPQSLHKLLADTTITRQAVSKHLAVLEAAGLVRCERVGRESQYALEQGRLELAQAYLSHVSRLWDRRLDRIRTLAEMPEPPRKPGDC